MVRDASQTNTDRVHTTCSVDVVVVGDLEISIPGEHLNEINVHKISITINSIVEGQSYLRSVGSTGGRNVRSSVSQWKSIATFLPVLRINLLAYYLYDIGFGTRYVRTREAIMINKSVTEIRSSTILTTIRITVTPNTTGVRFIRYRGFFFTG